MQKVWMPTPERGAGEICRRRAKGDRTDRRIRPVGVSPTAFDGPACHRECRGKVASFTGHEQEGVLVRLKAPLGDETLKEATRQCAPRCSCRTV